MSIYSALLEGPSALYRHLAELPRAQLQKQFALAALDIAVAHYLWRRSLPSKLRTALSDIAVALNGSASALALCHILIRLPPQGRRAMYLFDEENSWVAIRVAAAGQRVVARGGDRNLIAQKMCIALHNAQLTEALRLLFQLRAVKAERSNEAITMANHQAVHYMRNVVPLADQPSLSWEWRLFCAASRKHL